jgi:hypothetical protein
MLDSIVAFPVIMIGRVVRFRWRTSARMSAIHITDIALGLEDRLAAFADARLIVDDEHANRCPILGPQRVHGQIVGLVRPPILQELVDFRCFDSHSSSDQLPHEMKEPTVALHGRVYLKGGSSGHIVARTIRESHAWMLDKNRDPFYLHM